MTHREPRYRSGKRPRAAGVQRAGKRSEDENRSRILEELHLDSIDEVFKRWPDEIWASKGRPKLWIKVYEKVGITVWRDVAYGGVKLRTPEGVSEGKEVTSVNDTVAVCREGTLQIYVKNVVKVPQVIRPEKAEDLSLEEDTMKLEVEIEVGTPEYKVRGPADLDL